MRSAQEKEETQLTIKIELLGIKKLKQKEVLTELNGKFDTAITKNK